MASGLISGGIIGVLDSAFVYLLLASPSNPVHMGAVVGMLLLGLLPALVVALVIGIYLGLVGDFDYEAAYLPVGILGAIAFGATVFFTRGFFWAGFVPLLVIIMIGVGTCWVRRRLWGASWEMG